MGVHLCTTSQMLQILSCRRFRIFTRAADSKQPLLYDFGLADFGDATGVWSNMWCKTAFWAVALKTDELCYYDVVELFWSGRGPSAEHVCTPSYSCKFQIATCCMENYAIQRYTRQFMPF